MRPYNENFQFFVTTKMANPHYLPEICIKAGYARLQEALCLYASPQPSQLQLLGDCHQLHGDAAWAGGAAEKPRGVGDWNTGSVFF